MDDEFISADKTYNKKFENFIEFLYCVFSSGNTNIIYWNKS